MNQSQEARQTISSASIITLSTAAAAIVGFFLQILVAFHFGTSSETDAYVMAQRTSEMLSKMLLGGSIAAVFLPLFVERITHGRRQEAWQLGLNLIHLATLIFIVAIVLLAIFAEPFVQFIAPGFDSATTTLTISLLRVLLPSFLFLFLVDLITAMLHAIKHFLTPALLRIVAPLVSIIAVLTLVQNIGIYALAIGVVVGSAIQLTLVAFTLRRNGFRYQFVFRPRDPVIKQLLKLLHPLVYASLITVGAGIVYRILVSELITGSLASLNFAERITQPLSVMFLASVTTVVFPLLSEKASRRDYQGMRETIGFSIRLITFTTVPIIIGVILLSKPLVTFLYQRASFTAESTALTSIALVFFVLGLTINGISSVFGHSVLALKETTAAAAVTIASQAVSIALFVLLVPHLAHAGLALASSLGPLSIALLYFLYLTRYIDRLHTVFWHPTFIKIALLSAGLAAAVIITMPLSRSITDVRQLSLILQLVIPTLAGSIVFLGGAYIWRVPEMHHFISIFTGVLAKLKRN